MKNKKPKIIKFVICSLLLLMLFPSIVFGKVDFPKPTSNFYVNDYADVIDEEVENLIVVNGEALEEKTGAQIVIVTIDFTDGISIDEYAADLFNEWKLGSAEKNNGLLILMSIGDEDYWAVQGKGLETTLTSGEISQILYDHLEPDFASEDYSRGAARIYEAFTKRLGGSWTNKSGSGEINSGNNDSRNIDGNGGNNNKNYDYYNSINVPNVAFNISFFVSRFFKYLFFFIFLLIIISSQRRRYYRRRYGVPINPFSWFRRRRYGPGGHWGHFGPPPPGGGFWYGGRWNSEPRHRRGPGPGPGPGPGAGPFSSGGSPFGRSGGGGSTRGGGAGRSFFGGGSFGSSPFSGSKSFGGGSKPFGGRSSFGGGKSFGGRSGGGGFTRGGGAGRRK
ncbi:MAG: TPM domain-containing protein [Clostridiaceae bacterium]|nr:TPM domain-containing protein [Clostridiaceae bacterium]